MERIQEILTTIDNWLWGNWLLFVLLAVGILYTVISGGVQVRHFKYIIKKTLIHPIATVIRTRIQKEACHPFRH